jgi:hypothetical protein
VNVSALTTYLAQPFAVGNLKMITPQLGDFSLAHDKVRHRSAATSPAQRLDDMPLDKAICQETG